MRQTSRGDGILVSLAALHAAIVILWPAAPLMAAGIWWNSNTVSHNFIHRPFFRSKAMNRLFSAGLSLLLGIPQALWRERHLAHHAGTEWHLGVWPRPVFETLLVLCLWAALAAAAPHFFLLTYLPGYLAGLALCAMQGRLEHVEGQPVSHYGRIYNFLCFNDGYHAEHHAAPGVHWTKLPQCRQAGAMVSSRPALLRWLDIPFLELLERLVLRSPRLQRLVIQKHRRALETLLPGLPPVRRVTIVGGGLFPRTALILRDLLPEACLTILDSGPQNIRIASGILNSNVECRNARFIPGERLDCDLTVIPLSLKGDRGAVYACPPSTVVLVHDWIWRRRGAGAVVSTALLKRINLVRT